MIYVVIQFACIVWLLFQTNIQQFSFLHLGIFFLAGLVGVWAVISMRLDNLNIAPALKSNHRLVTAGIYQYIRHPMYTSVLIFCTVLLSTNINWINGLVYAALTVDLVLKLRVEEGLLANRFPEYQDYQKRTKRIAPFIY